MVALTVGTLIVAALTWVLDARSLGVARPGPDRAVPQREAVEFLRANTQPCPVAQLPVFGATGARAFLTDTRGAFYPYLVAPEYSWSYGYWGPDTLNPTNEVGDAWGPADLSGLRDAGFCAVLWDRRHAADARAAHHSVPGRDPSPGMGPDHDDGRFVVFLLND